MSSMLKSLVVLFTLAFMMACSIKDAPVDPLLLAVGDSIGNGYGFAKPWPELIGERLNVPFINESKSGERTEWGLSQIDSLLELHEPTHVLIMLGTNDVIGGHSLDVSLQNLQEMIYRSERMGAQVFISTIPPIPAPKYASVDQRGAELSRGLWGLDGATVVDSRVNFIDPVNLLADGLHPNQDGQNIIAQAFIRKLDIAKK